MDKKTALFTSVPVKKPSRNLFDLSHELKTTGKFSYLYPIMCEEVLPGDTWRNTSTLFLRMAPMLAPIMHRVNAQVHFFNVPARLVCSFWEDFITGGQQGDWASGVLPYITPAALQAESFENLMRKGTVWDGLGLPVLEVEPGAWSTEQISLLPIRAYAKIWNDYYRDPNFDNEINLSLSAGGLQSANAVDCLQMRRKSWAKDYFTSCLATAQRGASVLIPMDGVAKDIDGDIEWKDAATFTRTDGSPFSASNTLVGQGGTVTTQSQLRGGSGTPEQGKLKNIDEITFRNTEITINDFRTAMAIQKWLEVNARSGYRYIDQIMAHFGQRVSDYRLQRAEYIGGGKQAIQISEVLATAKTEVDSSTTPVGDLSGHGISVGKSNSFTYHCEEHGFILGILSVTPEPAYQQGLPRMFSRKSRYDYAWPEFAHIGEQEVLSKEIFYSFAAGDDDDNQLTFGYIPRFSEYKFRQDRVGGDFHDTLAFWHLGRIFTSRPVLDENFTTTDESGVTSNEEPMNRIFAVQDGTDYLWMDIFHRCTVVRPLPYFGVPDLK